MANKTISLASSIVRLFPSEEDIQEVVGTGFLVGTKYVVTCAHIVTQALDIADDTIDPPLGRTVSLDFPKSSVQKRFTAHLVCWHPPQPHLDLSVRGVKDIAVLELDEIAPHDALATHFALPGTGDHLGHQFYTYGFPRGYNQSVSASGELRSVELNGWMQLEVTSTTAIPIEPGFSGAPVWDKNDGGVVGMVVEIEKREGIRVAFAIPTEILIEAWPELDDYVSNNLSSIAEDLTRYLQRLRENLSWLPGYYPHGFSFDYIRQRIRMKQQTFAEDEMQSNENTDLEQESGAENKPTLKEEEQAYKTRTDDTDLSVSTVENEDTILAGGGRASLQSGVGKKTKTKVKTIVLDWETIRNEVKRVVILGDPGSGKSWLLKYEARAIALEQLEKLRQGQLRQDEVILPVFLRLGAFAEEIHANSSNVLELILSLLKQEYELSEQFLLYVRHWLEETQCLLLLDGLDEVAEDRRTRMKEALRQLAENSSCRILLTSRIVGYRGVPFVRKEGMGGQEMELVAFTQEQIEGFIDSWFYEHVEYGQHLLSTLRTEPPLRLLAGIPLLLSFLCLATALCDTIPTRRAELYETVLRLLLEASWRSDMQKGQLATHAEEKQSLLEFVAWHFAKLNGRWHDIMIEEELEEALEKWTQIQLFDEAALAGSILEELVEKDAILVRVGVSRRRRQKEKVPFLFLHRTFHEFLVARYLANLPLDEYLALIRPHLWFDTDWEVVILLLAGCLEDPNPLLVTLLHEPQDVFHSMLLLAGRCLIEANKSLVRQDIKTSIIERLFSLLYSPAERDRTQVIPILAKMGDAVIDRLLSIAEDRTYEAPIHPIDVREAAIEVLGQINHPRVVSGLVTVLQNERERNISAYMAAVKALARIDNQQSAQALIDAYALEFLDTRRYALRDALVQMSNPLALEMLERKILEKDTTGSRSSIYSWSRFIRNMPKIGSVHIVGLLLRVLADSYKTYGGLLSLRNYIARHLSLIADPDRKELLITLLKDEPTIYQALRHIGEPAIDAWLEVVQQINGGQGNVFQSWESAWNVEQPDEEVVNTFLEALRNNPRQYQSLLSIREIAAWVFGRTSDSIERDEYAARLKALNAGYDDDYFEAVIAQSIAYQGISSREGLLTALGSIAESETKQYLDSTQLWILFQILNELIKIKKVEKQAYSLALDTLYALREIGGRKVVGTLIDLLCLENKEPWNDTFKRSLITALGRIRDPQAIKILLEILHNSIKELKWNDVPWFLLFDEIKVSDWLLFKDAVNALGEISTSQAIDPLLTLLQETNDNTDTWRFLVWTPIIEALGRIGDSQAVDVLFTTIYHEDRYVRAKSAEALGNISDVRAVNMLLTNLSTNPFRKILSLAIEQISNDETGGSALWAGLRTYREWRSMTEDALIIMAEQGNTLVVNTLRTVVQEKKINLRRIEKAVFGRSSHKRDIFLLLGTLLDKSEDIHLREEAAELLGHLGDIHVVEGLLVCLQEDEETKWNLYRTAERALERLAEKCDPSLFCKHLLDADTRLALDKDAHVFIYELLAQYSPQLRDTSRNAWHHWRARLMQPTNYVLSRVRIQMLLSAWGIKIMEIYTSFKKAQEELSLHQQNKNALQYSNSSAEDMDVMGTLFALIGLKETTVGWLSYLFGWVTGLIFFLLWRRNSFVRFHAIQSMLLFGPINILILLLYHFSRINILWLICIFTFICWILLMTLARKGKYFKLPLIGACAKKLAFPKAH